MPLNSSNAQSSPMRGAVDILYKKRNLYPLIQGKMKSYCSISSNGKLKVLESNAKSRLSFKKIT